jgi:hypothetical protein
VSATVLLYEEIEEGLGRSLRLSGAKRSPFFSLPSKIPIKDLDHWEISTSGPSWIHELHLPSDFEGLRPVTFRSSRGSTHYDQADVAPALYHLKNSIGDFSPPASARERVIYEATSARVAREFDGRNNTFFKGKERVGSQPKPWPRP